MYMSIFANNDINQKKYNFKTTLGYIFTDLYLGN